MSTLLGRTLTSNAVAGDTLNILLLGVSVCIHGLLMCNISSSLLDLYLSYCRLTILLRLHWICIISYYPVAFRYVNFLVKYSNEECFSLFLSGTPARQ